MSLHWIDDADHWICPVCGFETGSPAKYEGCKCPKCGFQDEKDKEAADSLVQGASKLPDWLIISTSSEGTVRNGVGDTIKMELMDILKGKYYAPHVSIWHYKLDSLEEIEDPDTWVKANPNLGKSIEYEAYHLDVERI